MVCAFLYAHIDKMTRIYDKNIDAGDYVSMGLRDGKVFEQTFKSKEDILDGIEIMCLTSGNVQSAQLVYELVEAESGESIRTGNLEPAKANSGKFYRISFEQIKNCEGKEYVFSITQKITEENSGIAFYYAPEAEEDTQLIIDEKMVDGTTVMREISHRFDLETFIVFLSFVLYIVLFMEFLIKLFK